MNTFSCEVHTQGDVVLVTLRGDIDLSVADELWERLGGLVDPARRLVVDCSGVSFVDSLGLSSLIRLAQAAADAGAPPVTLTAPSPAVRRILELSGTGERFAVTEQPAGA